MYRIMQHQVNFLQGHLCQAIRNTLFHTSNWTDKETGQVATNACGRDLSTSHYGRLTLVDNVSKLYMIAKPLIEEKICENHQNEVASFTTNTAPEALAAGAETETETESTNPFVMFAKTLMDKVTKTNDSIEKEEKREKPKEIKWKYQLLGSTLIQGAHRTACKPGVLLYEFNKLLNRASLTNTTELLKDKIAGKMRSLKQDIDEISFFTNFQTEIINQAFAVNVKNCIWQKEAIEDYKVETMDQRLSTVRFLLVDPDHPRYKSLLESEQTHGMNKLHKPNRKKRAKKSKTLLLTENKLLYTICIMRVGTT